MKIICTDNFDRETVSDTLVCENINLEYGNAIVEFLNDKFSGDYLDNFFQLVEDDHKLYDSSILY